MIRGVHLQEFLSRTASEKAIGAQLRPVVEVTGWAGDSPSVFAAPLSVEHDGYVLDVVAVHTTVDPSLARVETLALCRSTPGSYYYDPEAAVDDRSWDDGLNWWEQSITSTESWDAATAILYVHLSDGSNPGAGAVAAGLAVHVASHAMVEPDLGPSLIADPGFEDWDSGTDLAEWEEDTGGCVVSREDSDSVVLTGTYCARVEATAGPSVLTGGVRAPFRAEVAGAWYRALVTYRTGVANTCAVYLRVGVPVPGLWIMDEGGRDYSGVPGVRVADTQGEWRTAWLDFRAFQAGDWEVAARVLEGPSGGRDGVVYFDRVDVRRIYRTYWWAPRLSRDSVPSIETGSNDCFFGGKSMGAAQLHVANADGSLDQLNGTLDWVGCQVLITAGGRTSDGLAVEVGSWRQLLDGVVLDHDANDAVIGLALNDARSLIHRELPTRTFMEKYPDVDPAHADEYRRLLFGPKTGIDPVRVQAVNLLGTYELADCSDVPEGLSAVTNVYAYVDVESADAKMEDKRIALVLDTDYSADLVHGTITLLSNPGPFEITGAVVGGKKGKTVVEPGTDRIEIDAGAGRLIGNLTPGLYTAVGLAAHIQTVLLGLASNMGCTYDPVSHKFKITRTGADVDLLMPNDGAKNSTRSVYPLIGFTSDTDLVNQRSYESDTAVMTDANAPVLRVDATGYKDDAAGTFTGTPGAAIQLGPDLVRLLWVRFMRQDAARIDGPSFLAARTLAPELLGAYLTAPTATKDLFDMVEWSNLADISIDGDGVVYFFPYLAPAPGEVEVLAEDVVAFEERREAEQAFGTIIVEFDQDPATGEPKRVQKALPRPPVRYGRGDTKTFATLLTDAADAAGRLEKYSKASDQCLKMVRLLVRSKVAGLQVGRKVTLSRARASMQPTGSLAAKTYRIRNVRGAFLNDGTEVVLVEDVNAM